MKRILISIGLFISGAVMLVLLLGAGLFVYTAGEHTVPATVSDDPTLPRVELNGHLFHTQTFGNPDNPVVLVLHGGPGGDHRSLLGLQALADNYFVVFYDQRGAGLSARVPAEELTYQAMLEDLDAFVAHYGQGKPVHLVGHSWGAMLASGYLGYAPEKVGRAVLAEPGFLNAAEAEAWRAYQNTLLSGPEYLWTALLAGFKSMHVQGPDAYANEDYLIGVGILPMFLNHPDNPYHCPGEAYDAPSWRWGSTASNAIQMSATPADLDSLSDHAGGYDKPVLFLAGACNTWIGPELQAQHTTLYPAAELTIIPNAGHDMIWDNPDATIPVIRAFLSR